MDGGTTGGPVVKTRVCMGIAASTLARLLQVSSNDQAKGVKGRRRRNVTVTVHLLASIPPSKAELRAVCQPVRTWLRAMRCHAAIPAREFARRLRQGRR